MVSLLPDEAPPLLDDGDLGKLMQQLEGAAAELATSREVPAAVRAFIRKLPTELHAESPVRALQGDPYLAEHAFAGSARAAVALLEDDQQEARRQARLALEQVRQALRDALAQRAVADDVEPRALVHWLDRVLGLPQPQLARLVGTSPRTWQRWLAEVSEPDQVQSWRLRQVAQLVVHLRHSLTGPGVARWFYRHHPLIKEGAGRPIDLLDDPEGLLLLKRLAAGLRSTQAT